MKTAPTTAAPTFTGGRNLALKTPNHLYDETCRFYAEILGLPRLETHDTSTVFAFGAMRLWVDRVDALSQPELWLEVTVDDQTAAADHLGRHGVVRCDSVEALPENFPGFWVGGPGGIVHLIAKDRA